MENFEYSKLTLIGYKVDDDGRKDPKIILSQDRVKRYHIISKS